MADTSSKRVPVKRLSYFQQRFKNRIFEAVMGHFVERAKTEGLTRKDLAERLGKDPALVSRWLSAPSNWSLDTVSDLLVALDAELEVDVVPFEARARANHRLSGTHDSRATFWASATPATKHADVSTNTKTLPHSIFIVSRPAAHSVVGESV